MSIFLITAISSLSVFILTRLLAIIAVVGKSGALLGLLFADYWVEILNLFSQVNFNSWLLFGLMEIAISSSTFWFTWPPLSVPYDLL